MKNKISKVFSIFLLVVLLFCEFAPVTALAASSTSKTINLYGYGISKSSVKIQWSTKYDYDYYLVYRAKDNGSYKKITKVTSKSYTDKELATESTYYYKIVGVDDNVKTTSNVKKLNPIRRVTPYVSRGDRNRVIVEWSYPKSQLSSVTGFIVYRKAEDESSYTKLGTLSKQGYFCINGNDYIYDFFDTTDKSIGKKYYYQVIPYRGSKRGYSKIAEITVEPYLILSTTKKEIKINWTAYPKATTYNVYADIYKYDEDGRYDYYKSRKITTTQKGESKSFTISGTNTEKYMYIIYIEAYKTVKGKLEYLGTYSAVSSESPYSLMRNAASDKAKTSYSVVSYRGEKPKVAWTETISAEDKKIISDFAKLHFQSGMTKTEKAMYIQKWIHYNNTYDTSYTTSSKYSYVKCIFEKKTGQCLQYNAALVECLNNLGFEARLIQGYRHQNAGHFWGEIKVAGRWYCMETGTNSKDPGWEYFCERYGAYGATNYNICGTIT